MPAYRWRVLRRDGFTRAQLQVRARSPSPVDLLEHRDARGAWSAMPAQEFVPEAEGVAVSLREPGKETDTAGRCPLGPVRADVVPVEVEAEACRRPRASPR
ncbi:hypothetical protein [Corallococcus sicarius]|uniref:Uncharacterized protein n=1 Tax=Corallococcus sicarius TaxID=2316726 RepID=A0A3A8NRN6_9BACT|nr:hypothetical protein [Corallococcus sicarius]RKH47056.1 hypothetical protein D7X12_04035 [Corallococcus sicarius]